MATPSSTADLALTMEVMMEKHKTRTRPPRVGERGPGVGMGGYAWVGEKTIHF